MHWIARATILSMTLFGAAFAEERPLDVHRVEIAIRAPVECASAPSCGGDFDPESAHNLSDNLLFPAIESNICSNPYSWSSNYAWALVEKHTDGLVELNKLLSRANSSQIFNNRMYVEALPIKANQRRIALCEVSSTGGPPTSCATVVVFDGVRVWMRGKHSKNSGTLCTAMAITRASGSIGISYTVKTKENVEKVANSIRDTLTKTQKLSIKITPYNDSSGNVYSVWLNSSAPLRDSLSLPRGWRESFDFDVFIGRRGEGDHERLEVNGTLRALVSRLASGNLTEYQGLNDAQRNTYATIFDGILGDAIKIACNKSSQIDAESIVCE